MPATLCFLGLCALTMLFMSFDLIGACFDPESVINVRVAMDFILGTLSMYLEWLLPAVFLLSTLYTMWQFCRHSELIAMRASGIGMATVVAPIILTACVAAGISFCNTEFFKPVWADRAMKIKNSDFKSTGREPMTVGGYVPPGGERTWSFASFDITNPNVLRDVTVEMPFSGREFWRVKYTAPVARFLDGVWHLEAEGSQKVEAKYIDEFDYQVNVPPSEFPQEFLRLQLFAVNDTPEQIRLQHTPSDLMSAQELKEFKKLRVQGGIPSHEKDDYSYKAYSHYAAPAAIILVTLFAIPAGIASGRQSVFRGILLALGMFLSYYVITALSMYLAKSGIVTPACAVALPLICFGSAAVVLFRKVR